MRGQLNGLKELIDSTLQGPPGPEGPQGPAGDVSLLQLTDALAQVLADAAAASSANSNSLPYLNLVPSDPPTQADVQTLVNAFNDLVAALRR
jgi:hypothetical protein